MTKCKTKKRVETLESKLRTWIEANKSEDLGHDHECGATGNYDDEYEAGIEHAYAQAAQQIERILDGDKE